MKKKRNRQCCFVSNSMPKILRKMKLVSFLMLISVVSVTANSYSQQTKFNMNLENITVRQVFQHIEENSEFILLYSEESVDVNRRVDIMVNNENIDSVLDQVFEGTNNRYEIHDRQIAILLKDKSQVPSIIGSAQKKDISGQVNDSSGQPLPGVSIVIKGTTAGTITDFDGNFSLKNVSSEATLVFSFVGMKTIEIAVANQSTFNIVMEDDAIGLEEVVAIGYGVQKKADLTGAISSVSGSTLSKASVPNLSSAITGKVTGVTAVQTSGQPGFDGATISIRGKSTTGNNAPLVIVDGVVRSMSRIDPNDIESLTVLKDAASTAVYGARAANGVLLITTKRGSTGKPSYDYTGTYGLQSQTRKMEMMNAGEYAQYINEAKANFGEDLLFTEEEVAKYKSGELPSYDWMDEVLGENAPIQKHNLSVSGGTEDVKYFLSYGYLDQDGLYSTAKYKQNNLRSNINVKLSDRLDISVDLAGRIEDRLSSPSSSSSLYQGTVMARPYLKPVLDASDGVPAGSVTFNGHSGSPIGQATRSGSVNYKNYIFQSNLNLKYKVPGIDGLVANAFYSFDLSHSSNKTFQFPYVMYTYNELTGGYIYGQGGVSKTSLREGRYKYQQTTSQLSLNYSKKIKDHTVSALALFEQIETFSNSLSAFRDDFISTAIPELFAGGVDLWSNNGGSGETARRGYVGRIDYDYKGKYLFQANMRLDQSFNFPKDGRNGFFPAFSAGWRISEEDFMKSIGIISNLKLRGSWGKTGNDRVGAFQYLANMEFGGGTAIGNSFSKGIQVTGVANPNITWETATTIGIGLDLGIFDNKITVEADYFKKRTEDILRPNSGIVPLTFGASLPDENIGIVDSWGTEFAVDYNEKIGDLYLSVGANISWYDNKAIFVAEPETVLPSIAQTGRALGLRTGYLSDGLFQTQEEINNAPIQFSEAIHNALKPGDIKYKDLNGRDENGELTGKPDGKINSDDRTIIGTSGDPNTVFGLNIYMEYKGFDLTANFQGATDYSRQYQMIPFERDGNALRVMKDAWRPGNEDARYPRLSSGDLPANSSYTSDFWIEEVSFVKLRNLELGYSFKKNSTLLSKAGIDNVRIFFAGTNLLTISNVDWRDPEGASGGFPFYPQVKTVSLGLNVKF